LKKRNETVKAFDDALYSLYKEKARLNADLKAAEMRQLLYYSELTLLRDFEKKDLALGK
jgi:hypothetical protein